ncbi:MAG: ComF family protein [Pseudohongiellaceae bacterium]|jgi:ComF family protein
MVNKSFGQFLNIYLPHRCILCQQGGQQHLDLCLACQEELPQLSEPYCRCCAIPLPSNSNGAKNQLCAKCIKKPPTFNKLIAGWLYQHPADELINQFKTQYKLSHGKVLSHLLYQRIKEVYGSDLPDLIIPTPLHWRRLLSRGYNQSELIAQHLSHSLGIPIARPVERKQHTPKQQTLTAKQRHRNLRHAFHLHQPSLVSGKRIALIDDVVTTGATVEVISRCLAQADAKEIHIWCLARTPLPD